jgi:hypothetical protein
MHREMSLYIRHHASDCRVEEAIRAAGEDGVDKDAELAVTRWNGCTYEVLNACNANLLTVEVRPARSRVDVRSNWSRVPIPTPSSAT